MTAHAPTRPCNVCDSTDAELYLHLRGPALQALRCRACGMIYIGNNPVKDEDLSSLYTMAAFKGERELQSKEWYADYYTDCLAGYRESAPVIRQFQDNLRHIARFVPKGRLLDLGCATGVFLDVARKAGFDVAGVDFSAELVEYARTSFNVEAYVGTLEEQRFPAASVDVVTMLDVIEHIPRYESVLPEIRRVLKPGGVLFLRTPTEDAWMRSLAKGLHRASLGSFELPLLWFYSFEHVNSFSDRTLRLLLERHGFRVLEAYDESEAPDRLGVPWIVKRGLDALEWGAGLFGGRHKIVMLASPAAAVPAPGSGSLSHAAR